MHTAPIPKTLQDVRPLVRNMRPDGYILQTGGSATRQEIQVEGDQVNPLFRVTGVPLHTHNASALLQIEASMSTRTDKSRPLSYAGEFSELDMSLEVGEHYQATVPETRTIVERINKSLDRAIDWGVGRVELRPENSVNYISEPTRVISEIRTLVSPQTALAQSTHVTEDFGYITRAGEPVVFHKSIVMVPVLPVNNMHVESKLAIMVEADPITNSERNLHLEIWPEDVPLGMNVAGAAPFNNWNREAQSWSHANDGAGTAGPYPVARLAIGQDKELKIDVTGSGNYTDWDGRIAYEYDEANRIFNPVPQILNLMSEYKGGTVEDSLLFGSNGHLNPKKADAGQHGGSAAQQKTFNPCKSCKFQIDTSQLRSSRSKNGFHYITEVSSGCTPGPSTR